MIVESRKLERIEVRHLALRGLPDGEHAVWWYGAVRRNARDKTLPLVVVWFRELLPDGSWGQFSHQDVGITELALLQLGTVWNGGTCRSQIRLEERQVCVDFSPGRWRYATQARSSQLGTAPLIPQDRYPLRYGRQDRTEVVVFDQGGSDELLVPSLEFFSRCYGRSMEVNRVLSTYPWSEAEPRLHLPQLQAVPAAYWSVDLPANIYNDDAVFVAHVKYDNHARIAAKSIYSNLETQFDNPGGLAFPQIGPWFVGPAKLIVQGIRLDDGRFLALRIVGGTEPEGPQIWSFRENHGEAEEPAPDGAPQSGWSGGRGRQTGNVRPLVNVTSTEPAGHDGNLVEVLNPGFRIVGARREVVPQKLRTAKTQPAPPVPSQESDRHSPGERQRSGGDVGVASIHTETQLESHGAVRDVWEALLHLHDKNPELIESVGWYSPQQGAINFTDKQPCVVALLSFDEAQQRGLPTSASKWVYVDHAQTRVRGVLIAFVKTPTRSAYIFEIERRSGTRTAEDGTTHEKEESFCGLIVSPPAGAKPDDWIPMVLSGIRDMKGIMSRVASYCPSNLVGHYQRSHSKGDAVAGLSTLISALSKVGIDVPRPKAADLP